ncbi:MAG TPA: hypothetical protein VIL20_02025 [Sandaracinaceae bacterium]
MRARLVALLVSLACSACGEDRPEPPPALVSQREAQPTSAAEPAPPETAALGPPSDPAPAPADESAPAPLPAPQPGVAHVFVVPEGAELAIDSDAIVDLDPEGPPDPDGLSPSAERLVAERIERFRAATLRELAPFDLGDGFAATCEANLATRHFVSVVCRASTYGERGETAEYARTKLLAVEGSTVRDLELASLFLPGTDVKAIAREACDRFAEREDRRACNIPDDEWAFGLAEDGVLVLFAQGTMEEVAEFVLPYASVADRLLAAGPLALALDRRGITTRAVPVDPSAAAAIAANGPRRVARWAVAPMGATADLAAAWASLPEEQRARVSRADDYLVAADEASARAVAAILGTTATEVQVSESGGQPLTLARAARDVPLLRAPSRDAEVIATLPRGTLLVVDGPLDEAVARHPRVVVHAELSGFADVRRLSAAGVCAPDLAPFLEILPANARQAARTRTLRTALAEGGWGRATYVTKVEGTSHVALLRLGAGCTAERVLAQFTRPGTVERLETTRTARRGGETLVVTVTDEPSVSVHRFGSAEPLWTHALSTGERVETSVREADAWFPVVIQRPSAPPLRVTWGEAGITVAESPAP